MSYERGQYGSCPRGVEPGYARPGIGAEASPPGRSITPWIIGGVAIVGFVALAGAHASSKRPRLSAHEKEVRAWEAEFPGLPWYADQVKDSRQLDMWERARDYWEKKH